MRHTWERKNIRPWLRHAYEWVRAKGADDQTCEDVLALMNWPEMRKQERWAKRCGPEQIKASAIINANVRLALLTTLKEYQ